MLTALPMLATGFGFVWLAVVAGDGDAQFKITTKRASDHVVIKTEAGLTCFMVRSPTGISQMSIERSAENWPKAMLLHLQLPGLESFRVSNGDVTLHAAVSSQTGKARLWLNAKELEPLDAKSPFWIDIRIVGADGKPTTTLPLKGGHFELRLPPAIFAANPRSLSVSWIDFYRN